MISEGVLDLAVRRGIITDGQAQALRALAEDRPGAAVPPQQPPSPAQDLQLGPQAFLQSDRQDDEALRFVTSFADIFVSLGLALFFGSTAYFIRYYAGSASMWASLAALAWIVAEFFSRRRRLALPSIILLALFSVSVFMATSRLIAQLDPTAPLNWWHPLDRQSWMLENATSMSFAGLVTAFLTWLHYLRFRVPITIAAMAAALIAMGVGIA
jgi:hypothetical protein